MEADMLGLQLPDLVPPLAAGEHLALRRLVDERAASRAGVARILRSPRRIVDPVPDEGLELAAIRAGNPEPAPRRDPIVRVDLRRLVGRRRDLEELTPT